MKKSEWNEGLNNLDSDIVENHLEQKDILNHKKKLKGFWLRVGAVAACLAIIVSAVAVAPKLLNGGFQNPNPQTLTEVPILEDGHYSAKFIASLFDARNAELDAVATNAYTKVYAPNEKYLYINEIPDSEYLDLYKYNTVEKELNEQEFKEFIDGILPKISAAIGIEAPSYTIKKDDILIQYGYDNFEADTGLGNHNFMCNQTSVTSSFSYHILGDGNGLYIDGERIEVDQRLSDEEIISAFEPMKNKLFEIFGVSFDNATVIRKYNDYSEYGVTNLEIVFYNEVAHSINSTLIYPMSDKISVSFDNFKNYAGDTVSDSILTVASVSYRKLRIDISEKYELFAKAKRIPLEEAEELLYKGYVFGGHSCPLCMAEQEKVDFEGYDLVGLEYFGEIPFYTFFKEIGTAKNGNTIYAKTYVPAIKISGYEEYFESQKANHK